MRGLAGRGRAAAAGIGWHGSPGFLILGAQKAGTSALFEYLARHPELVRSARKELYFFSPESLCGWSEHPDYPFFMKLLDEGFDPAATAWARRWYHKQFRVPRPGRRGLCYEATPDYLYFPQSAERIHAYRADMKLIVLLRDPVERAFSAWKMFHEMTDAPYRQLRDERSFEEAVENEIERLDRDPPTIGTDYVRRGLYHGQLRRYLSIFPRGQILVMESRELRANTQQALEAVCRFLGVPPLPGAQDWQPVFVGLKTDGMPPRVRERLTAFYAPHNAALFDLLGRSYDWG